MSDKVYQEDRGAQAACGMHSSSEQGAPRFASGESVSANDKMAGKPSQMLTTSAPEKTVGAPSPHPTPQSDRAEGFSRCPKIGLALGSGSARGWSHIGVLRALEKANIKPDVVVGCSIGAFVGGAWVSDSFDAFEDWARGIRTWDVIRLMDVHFGGGLIAGERIMRSYQKLVPAVNMADLATTFATISTDLKSGREIWISEGELHSAVRASIALPGLLSPVVDGEHLLVDGGLTNPVPVSACRAMGADIVIAVNLKSDLIGRHQRRRSEHRMEPGQALGPVAQGKRAALKRKYYQQKNRISRAARKIDMRLLDGRIQTWFKQDEEPEEPSLLEVMAGSVNIMQDQITKSRMAEDPPEYQIAPKLGHMGLLDFECADQAIEAGLNEAEPVIKQLKAAMG